MVGNCRAQQGFNLVLCDDLEGWDGKVGGRSKREGTVAQMVKNSPAVWETGVQSLGREDSLGEGMATHFWDTP